jgi:arsenate reductase (thioredoxin)
MRHDARLKHVLFVCVENCNRSQMAEAFARMFGGEWVEAYSAGCRPLGRVHPKAVEAMRELGYDLTAHQSKSLTDLPDVEFDVAVTTGCGDPDLPIRANVRETGTCLARRRCPRRSSGRFVTSSARK